MKKFLAILVNFTALLAVGVGAIAIIALAAAAVVFKKKED
jgi:hypothetical protein